MSENTYDFGDILDEALKGKTSGDADRVRLNGTFKVVAKYADADRKTSNGHKQISIVWQVVGGPQADEEVWQNIVFSEKSKAVAGRTLLSLGVSPEYLKSIAGPENFSQGLTDIADALVGVEAELKIAPQKSNTQFDNFDVVELINGPHLDAAGPAVQAAPSFHNGPQAQPPTQVSYPTAAPVQVPGGFIPQV